MAGRRPGRHPARRPVPGVIHRYDGGAIAHQGRVGRVRDGSPAGPARTPAARPRSGTGSGGVGRRADPPPARAAPAGRGAAAVARGRRVRMGHARHPPRGRRRAPCASTSTTAAWTITTSRSSTRTGRCTACRSRSGADAVLEADLAAGPVRLFCSLFAGTPDSHVDKGMVFDLTGCRVDPPLDVDLQRRERLQLLAPARQQRLVGRARVDLRQHAERLEQQRAPRAQLGAAPRSSSAQVRRRRAAASSSARREAWRARRSA